MSVVRTRPFAVALAALLLALAAASGARAQTALRTIENPQGGHIVYGPVDGAANEAQAMGFVLRSVHTQCGDRPRVGRVFGVRGTGSEAVFFSVVKRTQGGTPVAGLIIASKAADHVEAALITDDAGRFGTTVNPMLQTLFGVWHPDGAAPGAAGSAAHHSAGAAGHGSGHVAALQHVTTADGSASVSLPPGWKMNPVSRYGTILATGPHDERVLLGSATLAMNSNDPRVARTEAFAQGAGRNTTYAKVLYMPYGLDPGAAFTAALQHMRALNGSPPADVAIEDAAPLDAPAPARCARLTGHVDPGDGKRAFVAIFCSGGLSRMGQFMNLTSFVTIPDDYAERERATAGAILASFSVDQSVVGGEADQMAAPEIARINAIGQRAAQQAAQAHAAEDAQAASVQRHWDSEDRNAQGFSNYLLDQAVIQDNENNAHATVWNSTADAMVRSNPDRYQYVDTPNYWKGIDY